MNEMNKSEQVTNTIKLEWLEPSFELLQDPQSSPQYFTYETLDGAPS